MNEAKQIIVDIETKDRMLKERGASWVFDDGYILGIAIKVDDQPSEYYPLNHLNEQNYDKDKVGIYIDDIFCSNADIIGHFLYYDVGWIKYERKWERHDTCNYRDTLLEAQLFHNDWPSYSLEAVCNQLNLQTKKMDIGPPGDIWKKPIFLVEKYACNDADATYEVDKKLLPIINPTALDRECKLIPILVEMKKHGIRIDEEQLDILRGEWSKEFYILLSELPIKDIWTKSSLVMLFNYLNIPFFKTATGQPSFTKQFLESIDHPVIKKLVKARELHRLINTFLKGIKSFIYKGKIHSDYFNGRSQFGGTLLGRFSSAHPNVQQIPQRTAIGLQVKSLFVPHTNGNIWGRFDYSHQEPRFSMHYASKLKLSKISDWLNQYEVNPDFDCYEPVTKQMQIGRQDAKTMWLARSYGMGAEHMAEVTGWPEEKCQEYLDGFDITVPWMGELMKYCINRVRDKGYIKTIGGRPLYFDPNYAYRAMNGLIQGSAADQTKQATIDIYERRGIIPNIQVHDELNYEFSEEEYMNEIDAKISDDMERAFILDVPSKVDFKMGANWKECCEK